MADNFNFSQALGSGLGMAGTGASIGSVIAPGVGTAVGAGLGLLGGAIYGGVTGAKQDKLSQYQEDLASKQSERAAQVRRRLEEQGRPQMEALVKRQEEIANLSRQAAMEGMPEEQYRQAQKTIERTAAASRAAAGDIGTATRLEPVIQAQQAESAAQLGAADAAFRAQREQGYLRSLGALGTAESQAEQFNLLQPYMESVAEAQALEGSAIQNQYLGLASRAQLEALSRQQTVDQLGQALMYLPEISGSAKNLFRNNGGAKTPATSQGGQLDLMTAARPFMYAPDTQLNFSAFNQGSTGQ
jgi:hypothetical protein